MRDMTGHVIQDRFRLDAFLAAGGMGAVYRGTQLSINRPVAVKLLHTTQGQATERFLREARSISGIAHPNIVSLIDYGRDEAMTYLVMELVQGASLARLSQGRVAKPRFVFELLYQVASGLVEAHARGLVHRDLKPDNLLVVRQASGALLFKIVDFGIAHVTNATSELTASGSVLGTPCYMSPEQAQDHPIDGRADLFSLGIIAYELVAGELPFYANETLQVMLKICNMPHAALATRAPSYPAELVALIERLLHKAPEQRIASASELLKQLDALRAVVASEPLRLDDAASWGDCFETQSTLAEGWSGATIEDPPLSATTLDTSQLTAHFNASQRASTPEPMPEPWEQQAFAPQPRHVGLKSLGVLLLCMFIALSITAAWLWAQRRAPAQELGAAPEPEVIVATAPTTAAIAASSAPVTSTHYQLARVALQGSITAAKLVSDASVPARPPQAPPRQAAKRPKAASQVAERPAPEVAPVKRAEPVVAAPPVVVDPLAKHKAWLNKSGE